MKRINSLIGLTFIIITLMTGLLFGAEPNPIKVGIYENKPKIYLDENGQASGFFPDILNYIAKQEGWTLEYIPCSWAECLAKLEKGELDLMPDVAWSVERSRRFNFNGEVVLSNWSHVYAKQEGAFHSILDLDGKRIAVLKDSYQADKLADEVKTFDVHPILVEAEHFSHVFELIEQERVDAGIVNRLSGAQLIGNYDIVETNIVLFPSRLHFCSLKGKDRTLLDRIDKHLEQLKSRPQSVYYSSLKPLLNHAERASVSQIELTKQENAWLSAHPEIILGTDRDWRPYVIKNKDGTISGVEADMIERINELTGANIRLELGNWSQMVEKARKREIDGLALSAYHKEREKHFLFTDNLYKISKYIFTLSADIKSMKDLTGKNVGLRRGNWLEIKLLEPVPGITLVPVDSDEALLSMVQNRQVDAIIGSTNIRLMALEKMMTNIKIALIVPDSETEMLYSVRKDWPELQSILNKALAVIPLGERMKILEKWGAKITPQPYETELNLSAEEADWLGAHPIIKVAIDPNWAPIEYLDEEGNLQGMSIDYLSRLEEILGVQFEIPRGLSWQEMLEAIKNKELDMFASIAYTPDRDGYLQFTKPYISMPIQIFTSREVVYIGDPVALEGKRVAVMEGYAIHEWLKGDYPHIDLVPVRTIPDALKMLTTGEVHAFIGNAVTTSYYIHKLRLYEIHVAGETPYANNQTMAVRSDWPILAGILQKALDSIPSHERSTIHNRSMAIRYEHGVDYGLLWKIALGFLLILAVILYWNWRLRREIAARKATEIALQQSEQRLQMVVDTVPVVLVVKDREGRHLLVNNNFEQATGVEQKDALGKMDTEIFSPHVAGSIRDFDDKLMATGKESMRQEEIPHPDGTIHTYFSRKVPLFDEQGKVTGLVLAALDITEQKAAEQELLLAKKAAETANQAKSLFLANMSHELRTPLNAILGFSEMLVRDREATSAQKEKLSIINRSGEHLLGMINDVLDLSKIEAGRVELEQSAFDLPLMLKDLGQMISVRADSAGLRFDLEIDPTLPQYIKTDVGKLRQILINLLGNAVTFTDKGRISLRAHTIPITDYPSMVTLKIEVEDSGPGIIPEQLEQIFQPFFQAEQVRSHFKGSGLGLAISKSFVELMGGGINVTSKSGKGSQFCVELPVYLAETAETVGIEAARPSVLGLEPGQPPLRILIAEDNTDNRLLLGSLLGQAGFEVQEVDNGEEAIAVFEQWHPHFIWMDMRMPLLDGYEATAKIRSLPGGDEVKIVAITASAFKEQRENILKAGCDDVVLKPFQSHEIFHTIEQLLKVRYIYEKEREVRLEKQKINVTSEILARLPSELRHALKEAAHKLDISGTEEVIERIRCKHPEIADSLHQLAREFRFEGILELLNNQ